MMLVLDEYPCCEPQKISINDAWPLSLCSQKPKMIEMKKGSVIAEPFCLKSEYFKEG